MEQNNGITKECSTHDGTKSTTSATEVERAGVVLVVDTWLKNEICARVLLRCRVWYGLYELAIQIITTTTSKTPSIGVVGDKHEFRSLVLLSEPSQEHRCSSTPFIQRS